MATKMRKLIYQAAEVHTPETSGTGQASTAPETPQESSTASDDVPMDAGVGAATTSSRPSPRTALDNATRLSLFDAGHCAEASRAMRTSCHLIHVFLVSLLYLDPVCPRPCEAIAHGVSRPRRSQTALNLLLDIRTKHTVAWRARRYRSRRRARPGRCIRGFLCLQRLSRLQTSTLEGFFTAAAVSDEERGLELASMAEERRERVLWVACRLSRKVRRSSV